MAKNLPRENIAKVMVLHPDIRAADSSLSVAGAKQENLTLGTTAQVTSIAIPDDAVGFRLSNASAAVYFNVNADPVAPAGVAYAASVSVATDFKVGNTVAASTTETRVLEPVQGPFGVGTGRTLRLLPSSNDATIRVEVW